MGQAADIPYVELPSAAFLYHRKRGNMDIHKVADLGRCVIDLVSAYGSFGLPVLFSEHVIDQIQAPLVGLLLFQRCSVDAAFFLDNVDVVLLHHLLFKFFHVEEPDSKDGGKIHFHLLRLLRPDLPEHSLLQGDQGKTPGTQLVIFPAQGGNPLPFRHLADQEPPARPPFFQREHIDQHMALQNLPGFAGVIRNQLLAPF